MGKLLEPVLITQFKRYGLSCIDTDLADCRDEVFRRIEDKLGRPMEFEVELTERSVPPSERVVTMRPGVLQASLLLDIADTGPLPDGCKVRLKRDGSSVEWEEDWPTERCADGSGQLPVHVPVRRLRHGASYCLELDIPGAATPFAREKFEAVQIKALHLLRAKAFVVLGHHRELLMSVQYSAQLRDMSTCDDLISFWLKEMFADIMGLS